jgi:hypothetical protein
MIPLPRMITAYVLALTLIVLPFSTSFGFFMTDSNFSMISEHTDSVECNGQTTDTLCIQISDHEQHAETDDECCSDHCNSFSGAQICTDITQASDIPLTDDYITTLSPRFTDLIPSQILRPPLHVS